MALAILNGTADKLELEKREKEENEYVISFKDFILRNLKFIINLMFSTIVHGPRKLIPSWKQLKLHPSMKRRKSPSFLIHHFSSSHLKTSKILKRNLDVECSNSSALLL